MRHAGRLVLENVAAIVLVFCTVGASTAQGWVAAGDETIESIVPKLRDGQVLIVEVSADWCAPCNQLQNEVLDAALGQTIVESDRGILVDFESAYGQEVKRRYGVLGLPTTFVLDREGVEIGRVEGYPGRAEWVEAVRDAKAGRYGIAALAARVKKAPDDLVARIQLAQARLVARADPKVEVESMRALDAIIERSRDAKVIDAAAHAARVKGRWLLRVKEDGPAALVHFAAMLKRFAGTKYAPHFRYWTASAHKMNGDEATALGVFEAWVAEEPESDKPLSYQADFMVHFGYAPEACEPIVRAALARTPESAELHYLLARVLYKGGDPAAAQAAVARAVELEPATAIYTNYQRQIAPATGAAATP